MIPLEQGSVQPWEWSLLTLWQIPLATAWVRDCQKKQFVTAPQFFCDFRDLVDPAGHISTRQNLISRVSLRRLGGPASLDLQAPCAM